MFINSFPRNSYLLFVVPLNTNSLCTLLRSPLLLSMFLCEHLANRQKIYVLVLLLLWEATVSACRWHKHGLNHRGLSEMILISGKSRRWCWGWRFTTSLFNGLSLFFVFWWSRSINMLWWTTLFVVLLRLPRIMLRSTYTQMYTNIRGNVPLSYLHRRDRIHGDQLKIFVS